MDVFGADIVVSSCPEADDQSPMNSPVRRRVLMFFRIVIEWLLSNQVESI